MRRFSLFVLVALVTGCYSPPPPDDQPADPVAPTDPVSPVGERVKFLIAHIDDNPDHLHADYTPAVHQLIYIGEPAIMPALDLMLSGDEFTRMRAQRVVEGVTMARYGFVRGQGWATEDGERTFRKFWLEMGGYDADGPEDQRREFVARWKKRHERPVSE